MEAGQSIFVRSGHEPEHGCTLGHLVTIIDIISEISVEGRCAVDRRRGGRSGSAWAHKCSSLVTARRSNYVSLKCGCNKKMMWSVGV